MYCCIYLIYLAAAFIQSNIVHIEYSQSQGTTQAQSKNKILATRYNAAITDIRRKMQQQLLNFNIPFYEYYNLINNVLNAVSVKTAVSQIEHAKKKQFCRYHKK